MELQQFTQTPNHLYSSLQLRPALEINKKINFFQSYSCIYIENHSRLCNLTFLNDYPILIHLPHDKTSRELILPSLEIFGH